MLNMAVLATPVSKGCIPTAHAHCFQATACWKAIMHLQGFCNQQTKHAVLSVSLLLKCHSLLHLLSMLID